MSARREVCYSTRPQEQPPKLDNRGMVIDNRDRTADSGDGSRMYLHSVAEACNANGLTHHAVFHGGASEDRYKTVDVVDSEKYLNLHPRTDIMHDSMNGTQRRYMAQASPVRRSRHLRRRGQYTLLGESYENHHTGYWGFE